MELSILSRKILRELCENSRVTITEISEKYNISRRMVKERISALETELGLKYVLELDYEALGFTTLHIVKLKFSKKVDAKTLKRIFIGSKVVQFAAVTKGDFDMVIFAMAKQPKEYFKWEVGLWTTLAKYGVSTSSSEVTVIHLGFMPINNELLEVSNLEEPYKSIISVLNQNSRMPIRELSHKVGLSETLVKYHLKKLNNRRIIKRCTAVVTSLPLKYNIIYFVNYTVREGVLDRVKNERQIMYWREPQEFPLLSEFQMMLSTSGSDVSFTWAIYDDYEVGIKQSMLTHERIYKKDSPVIKHAIIRQVVKGIMPLRNIDTKNNYDLTLGGPMDV